MKRVIVVCEKNRRVRDAFEAHGWDAWSCDIRPSSGKHIEDDALNHLDEGWDLMIAHPPCTFLCSTGARWLYDSRYPNRKSDRDKAVEFALKLWAAPIFSISLENPIGYLSTVWRQPDQIIQPFWFGHDASKATCLWLKNLPPLRPTKVVPVTKVQTSTGKWFSKWYWDTSRGNGIDRQDARSLTFQGVADAMADQWSKPFMYQPTLFDASHLNTVEANEAKLSKE